MARPAAPKRRAGLFWPRCIAITGVSLFVGAGGRMRYQIPDERPRGLLARFATRASSPYWATLVGGFLPSLVWSTVNAWLLGCRDAGRQTLIAAIGYALLAAIGIANMHLWFSGTYYLWFENTGRLVHALVNTVYILGSLVIVRVLVGRQFDLAAYRSTIKPLPWGFILIGLIVLADRFIMPEVYPHVRELFWIWGPSTL